MKIVRTLARDVLPIVLYAAVCSAFLLLVRPLHGADLSGGVSAPCACPSTGVCSCGPACDCYSPVADLSGGTRSDGPDRAYSRLVGRVTAGETCYLGVGTQRREHYAHYEFVPSGYLGMGDGVYRCELAYGKPMMTREGVRRSVVAASRAPMGHTHTCSHGHTWDHSASPGHNCPICGEHVVIQDRTPRTVNAFPASTMARAATIAVTPAVSLTEDVNVPSRANTEIPVETSKPGITLSYDPFGVHVNAGAGGGCASGNCPASAAPQRTGRLFRR